MLEVIRVVYSGRRYLPPNIADRLTERMMRSDLTARELEILELLARGITYKEIAAALKFSSNTVRKHVSALLESLRSRSN